MRTRKKILVFSDWFLPGYKAGGPIRSLANLVYALDFDFWIVTRITDHHSTTPYEGITPGVWTEHQPHVRVCYMHEQEVTPAFVKNILGEQTFDFLYFNSLFSPIFSLMPLRVARGLGLAQKCVLAPRGMLKPGALSIKARKKKVFLFVSRILGWFKGIRWHATNAEEASEIKQHYGSSCNVVIAPNLASIIEDNKHITPKEEHQLKLVCIARISEEKGIREALHYLKASALGAGLECDFYGTQQHAEYLEECKSIAATIEGACITFPGEIAPADIPSALQKAHFFYMTTWGENFGHAIAEALQLGKPVIISDRTPWRNLRDVQAGWDLPLQESSFVAVLKNCYTMSADEYAAYSAAARTFGSAHANDPKHIDACYSLFA